MKLPRALKRLLIVSFSTLYLCGVSYWLAKLFLKRETQFGNEPHWLETAAGPAHVSAALFFVFVTGMIWALHSSVALKVGKSRVSGWIFFGILVFLGGSGVIMLYAGESAQKTAEQLHPWVGASMLPLLVFHSQLKYRKKR